MMKKLGTKEGFNRPNNTDFMTSEELKKAGFSGTRKNSITNEMEIWTLGDLRASVPAGDKKLFEQRYAEVFGLKDVTIE